MANRAMVPMALRAFMEELEAASDAVQALQSARHDIRHDID